jgi:hypothetical protein
MLNQPAIDRDRMRHPLVLHVLSNDMPPPMNSHSFIDRNGGLDIVRSYGFHLFMISRR